jgi:hypothetical protein
LHVRRALCFTPQGFAVALGGSTEQNQRLQGRRISLEELKMDQPSSLEKKSRTHELATEFLLIHE